MAMAVAVPSLALVEARATTLPPPELVAVEELPASACSRVRVSPASTKPALQTAKNNNKTALGFCILITGLLEKICGVARLRSNTGSFDRSSKSGYSEERLRAVRRMVGLL